MPVKVGIYDSEYCANIYSDKIILTIPCISWVGNTGGYSEQKVRIDNANVVRDVLLALADDCHTTAWGIIGCAVDDAYLSRGQSHF